MFIKVKKTHEDAVIPTYGTDGAGAFDIYALSEKDTQLSVGDSRIFRTGLSFEIPEGHAMLVFSRSGSGFKNNVRLSNCVGVIDSK